MNIPTGVNWRNRRNINLSVPSVNYSTYSFSDPDKNMKSELYDMYHPDFKTFSEIATDKKSEGKSEKPEPWLIRSALHMCSVIYRKISGRASSPELSYHDCESLPAQDAQPGIWPGAKSENKNIEAQAHTDKCSDMNGCDSVVAACEDKLNLVRQLITDKPAQTSPKCTTFRSKRKKKVFVQPGSVEDSFEDAFSPEDFISDSNSDPLTFTIPYQYQGCEVLEIDAPKMKIETAVMNLKDPSVNENKEDDVTPCVVKTDVGDDMKLEEPQTTMETVSSCESKIMQLQALLKERRKKNTKCMLNSSDSAPEPVKDLQTQQAKPKVIPTAKVQDKRFKNRHRLSTGKRKKAETTKLIHDDMLFADEIVEDLSSFEDSPVVSVGLNKSVESLASSTEDCFDEVAGRFRSASGTDSDDSFQVVFTDSPRAKRPSDCESEDSFIIFEESPDSCYISHDVFGDETDSDSEYSDSDSEISDSGCGESGDLRMPHKITKTFGDLTDGSLYEDKDEVDHAVNICAEIPSEDLELESVIDLKSTGLLLNDAKKKLRKNQPPKKVQFSPQPPKVHVMRVWSFAARQARAGHWERHALDRERFKRRIADADMALSWVLKPQHRSRVMFQRFMPWWNAQKRKELAEKKQKAEEEKKLVEEERVRLEQSRIDEEQVSGDGQVNVEVNENNVEAIPRIEEKANVGDGMLVNDHKVNEIVVSENAADKAKTDKHKNESDKSGSNNKKEIKTFDKSEHGKGNNSAKLTDSVTNKIDVKDLVVKDGFPVTPPANGGSS